MVALNRSHPLARGLLWCVAGGTKTELVGGGAFVSTGGTPSVVFAGRTRWGKAYESTVTNGTNNVAFGGGLIEGGSLTTRHTLVMACDFDAVSAGNGIFSVPTTGSVVDPYQDLAFGPDSGAPPFTEWYSGGTRNVWAPGGTYWATGPHVYGWTRNGATQELFKDGASFTSSGGLQASAVNFTGAAKQVVLNGFTVGTPLDSQDGRIYFVGLWNRVLSRTELVQLSRDPNCLLAKAPNIWVAGGLIRGNPSPSAVAATFTIPTPTIPGAVNLPVTAVAQSWTIPTPSVTTAFEPTDITGCEVWLDADDASTFTFGTGTRVASWTDKSGNSYVFDDVGAGSSTFPERQSAILNGRAVVVWDSGALRSGNNDSITLSQPFTVFVVAKFTNTASSDNTLLSSNSGEVHVTRRSDSQDLWAHAGSPSFPSNTFAVTNNTPYYFTFVYNGSSSLARRNGSAMFTSVDVGSGTMTSDLFLGFMAGIGQSLATNAGYIAEFILYDSAIAGADLTSVESYLSTKWFTAAGTNVTPTAVAATFTIPTPAVSAPVSVPATVAAATFVIPTPVISTAVSATLTRVAGTFVVPTPTISTTVSVTANDVAATFVIPTPAVSAALNLAATVAAQTWTIPTPAVAGTQVAANDVAATFTIPTPLVSTGTAVSVTAVAATFVVPTPTRTATANVTATAVAQTWVIPTPSVTTGSNVSVGATTLAGTFTVPTPAVSGTQIAATAAAATFVIPTPAVGTPTNVTVTRVQMVASIGTSSPSTAMNVTPTAVAATFTAPTPSRTASSSIQVTTVAGVMAIWSPTLNYGASISVARVQMVFNVGASAPFVSAFGGNATQLLTSSGATQTITLNQSATQVITSQSATQEIVPI